MQLLLRYASAYIHYCIIPKLVVSQLFMMRTVSIFHLTVPLSDALIFDLPLSIFFMRLCLRKHIAGGPYKDCSGLKDES